MTSVLPHDVATISDPAVGRQPDGELLRAAAVQFAPRPYPHGTFARIAKRLRISRQHVREVARGARRNPRVERELAKARRPMQESDSLTEERG